ncbi:MAG: PD40 domain-containing protein [Myxococcales bacterium]|nr:PD40 domain-containing protein [Myxococcales bacterium]
MNGRSLGLALLAAVAVSVTVGSMPACSGSSESTAAGPTSLDGLVALTVSPGTASLEMSWGATATQAFVAVGSFADGTSGDVTSLVAWTTTLWGADIAGGVFSTTLPGTSTVTASGLGVSASATVTVKVVGEAVLTNTPPGASGALDGTPTAGAKPAIAYPLDGALFPLNLGNTEFQLAQGDAAQTVGRIDVSGDLIELRIVGPCVAIAGVAPPGGCALTLDDALVPMLAGASEGESMSVRVRLAAADGSALGESDAIDVRWTQTPVGGGLYYWSARDNGPTYIFRYDLDAPGTPPAQFFSNAESPDLHDGTPEPCVGCHAVSQDGRKMALTFGGSDTSDFELLDVATKAQIAVRNTDPAGFATMTALSPDGAYLATSFRGALALRAADATLGELATVSGGATIGEALSQPFWSADGTKLAFVGWVPGANGANASTNGDVVRGAQIFVADVNGATAGTPALAVARVAGRSSYYPALSDDGAWLVFNQSRCDGPAGFHPYGNDACDGYDDASAEVYVAPVTGGTPTRLARANGPETWTNSWPRWSPTHGTFRGKSIYFLAFSSKRPYGLRLPGSTDGSTPPQLWLAAVALEPGTPPGAVDPSFAPVWLPLQDSDMASPTGNHVPQWAAAALPIPN